MSNPFGLEDGEYGVEAHSLERDGKTFTLWLKIVEGEKAGLLVGMKVSPTYIEGGGEDDGEDGRV